MDIRINTPKSGILIDVIDLIMTVSSLLISAFIAFSGTVRPGLELYFLVPLTFSICQKLFGKILRYAVGGIGVKVFLIIESIRSVLLPFLIIISKGKISSIRMSYVSPEMYFVAVIIQCVEIVICYMTIYYAYPKAIKTQTKKYKNKRWYEYSEKMQVLGIALIGLFILILILRISIWLPALKLFLIKETDSDQKILLENTMLTCVKIVALAVTTQKVSKYPTNTKKYILGMFCVVILLLFNALSYFGTNRVFVLENMVASIMIVWISLPNTRRIIAICVIPVGAALIYTMIVVKQFNLENAAEFSSSIISIQSISNTVEEYVNGPWCIAQSYAASQGLPINIRIEALIADLGNGFGGIADLPIIKEMVKYASQFNASSKIMKDAFETYDRGQMLSLSGGLFIPFGTMGWMVFPLVNYILAKCLVYVEIKSKVVDSLLYKYMYIWMSILLGLLHCYCIETILFCWSKFIFIYWIVLKINDLPVVIGKKDKLV